MASGARQAYIHGAKQASQYPVRHHYKVHCALSHNAKRLDVSKLSQMKEWLTIQDAARHLSNSLSEVVSEADVLRLALDGHLKISVNFVNRVPACRGKIVPVNDSEYQAAPRLEITRGKIQRYKLPFLVSNGRGKNVIELENVVFALAGVYDLPMIGFERQFIEQQYHNLTSICTVPALEPCAIVVKHESLGGVLVECRDGTICQIQENFNNDNNQPGSIAQLPRLDEYVETEKSEGAQSILKLNKYEQDQKIFMGTNSSNHDHDNLNFYFCAFGMPADCVLVVRTEALRHLEESINKPSDIVNEALLSPSSTAKAKGHLNHDPDLQRRANELAAEIIKTKRKAPTKDNIAKILAKESDIPADTVLRRIRLEWK